MKALIAELRRRKVVNVAAGYAVVAWIVAQVADLAADNFGAPAWFMPMLLIVLALGLPVAVVLAWAFETSPEGVRRTDAPAGSAVVSTRTRVVAGIGLVAVLAAAVTFPIWRPGANETGRSADAPPPAGTGVRRAAPAKSVAVLPFVDLSQAGDQEWFADGLTEEILNSLAALPELKVISRTSSFQFKGQDRDVTEIADTLGVANVVEGSVRRFDDDLVVTAQLIRASDGTHLWSQTYERSAADLFDVQRDVAEKVAATLDVFLDDAKREAMFSSGTRDVEAFEAYRKGRKVMLEWHADNTSVPFDSANVYFDRAMALDTGYAEAAIGHMDPFAHILLDGIASPYTPQQAVAALQRDLEFAASHASGEATRLVTEINRVYLSPSWHRLPGLVDRLDAAVPPGQALPATSGWTDLVVSVADPELARRLIAAEVDANPLDPVPWSTLAGIDLVQGRIDAALAVVDEGRRTAGDHRYLQEAEIFATAKAGRRAELVEALRRYQYASTGGAFGAWLDAATGDTVAARQAVTEAMAPGRWPNEDLLFVMRELGDREAAAELAARVDGLTVGPAILLRAVAFCGCVPFDPADTPNLRARLDEAGIDLSRVGKPD